MTTPRRHFHDELKTIEQELVLMAGMAERAVGRAVDALFRNDITLAGQVVAEDQQIDDKYLLIHEKWLETMALQTPVAIDLRLMSSVLASPGDPGTHGGSGHQYRQRSSSRSRATLANR